jgi:alkylation response protein AidB-like acyl-CoA dehydrogenase
VNFTLSSEAEHYRVAVRQTIAEVFTAQVEAEYHRSGTFDCPELNRALADRGLVARVVPGLGAGDPIELWLLFHELEIAGAPRDGLSTTLIVAATINHVGTEEQKARVLPRALAGDAHFAQGYSEPDYGSDLGSIATRAVREGDRWVINGAKMWTTMAHKAEWVLLLTRTNPDRPKHKGLSMFLVPMSAPGVSIRPVPTMSDEVTNATFYDDVRVGDEWLVGEVDGGWDVMRVVLSFERGVMGNTNLGVPLLRHFRHWAAATGIDRDPIVRERMARIATDNEVSKLLTQRAAWLAAQGRLPGLDGSMTKLFASETYQKATRWLQEAAGAAGLLRMGEAGAAADGHVDYDARHAPVMTIYGGTSEINRNNIAERHLGLPRSRR